MNDEKSCLNCHWYVDDVLEYCQDGKYNKVCHEWYPCMEMEYKSKERKPIKE